ncbi:MAG TPA: hypothetical protein VH165_37810 [Kofleriaceae bacterium]|jgi:hypothetical protein|nr:hypothetical protein [Kofleriaceae bacterium]
MATLDTIHKIDELRGSLADKLGELHRRATYAKRLLTPATYWRNPWARLGLGAAIGFLVASGRRNPNAVHEGLLHAMVRSGLSAAVAALVSRSLPGALDSDHH